MKISEFIHHRETLINEKEENAELSLDVINMLNDLGEEYILPLLGRPFFNSNLSRKEEEAVIEAVYNCLCETEFSYMMFGITQLEVSEHEDGILVIFDALTINGDIVRDIEAIMDDSCAGYANWQTKWMYEGDK